MSHAFNSESVLFSQSTTLPHGTHFRGHFLSLHDTQFRLLFLSLCALVIRFLLKDTAEIAERGIAFLYFVAQGQSAEIKVPKTEQFFRNTEKLEIGYHLRHYNWIILDGIHQNSEFLLLFWVIVLATTGLAERGHRNGSFIIESSHHSALDHHRVDLAAIFKQDFGFRPILVLQLAEIIDG